MSMHTFRSIPTEVEAVHVVRPYTAADEDRLLNALRELAPDKVRGGDARWRENVVELLAGKDGAQEWVPVPWGHWIVRQPGDPSNVWPVVPDYFASKYTATDTCAKDAEGPQEGTLTWSEHEDILRARDTRIEALRLAHSVGGGTAEAVVTRAKAYEAFVTGRQA